MMTTPSSSTSSSSIGLVESAHLRPFDRRSIVRSKRIREDHPPNLSILVSGGKETNQDFLSSGERTGMSPALNRAVLTIAGDVVFGRFRYLVVAAPVQVRLERGRFPVEGARPVATERGGERDTPQSRVA
ncbi:jg25270 [Pararge aegeria aegeria]|uniref:Jg25270 protein n=1 Tax=Pararge aegeria aegeria TaxID=348720 RepID=A0A8S4QPL2_9NEOP|nr:jg25270 [Pararge aegeria aegeria]